MTIQDWGAIGEILGGIAVVATLIYLSIQLRQASAAIKISTAETGTTHNAPIWREMIANPELTEPMMRGGSDIQSLDEVEYARFLLGVNMQMRFFEHQFLLHQEGAIHEGFWEGMKQATSEVLGPPGARLAWEEQKHVYSLEFVEMVSSLALEESYMLKRD
jgi:hypothetical protein